MACRLIGATPLSESVLTYCQLRISMKFDENSNFLIQENAFENVVYGMAANLSRAQCVKLCF